MVKHNPSNFIKLTILGIVLILIALGCKITEDANETPKENIPFVIENLGVNFAK